MNEMQQKILRDGQVLPGHILKVGSFLNQQIDVAFLTRAAREIAARYEKAGVTKVMTIEASGIPFATLIAQALGVPAVIVKKHPSANQSKDVYAAEIFSYTHGNRYTAVLAKEYLSASDRVLIADDFLACGNAIAGMMDMIAQAGARTVGCAIAIEKGFQKGGDALRAKGVRVDSLAIVDEMGDDGSIRFRDERM